ncbi:hypothetical protein LINPERHAP2_LOCUS12965 [Linum perenne]
MVQFYAIRIRRRPVESSEQAMYTLSGPLLLIWVIVR